MPISILKKPAWSREHQLQSYGSWRDGAAVVTLRSMNWDEQARELLDYLDDWETLSP